MIALVAGEEPLGSGPIPIALAHAGFEACEALGPDAAARRIGEHGPQRCLLVLDARSLSSEAGSAPWSRLLEEHDELAVVLVLRGTADPGTRALARAPHRILVENPFDAAAVVAAAIRASASARHRVHRVSSGPSPGSKYAS